MTITQKTKAQERFAEIQKRESGMKREVQTAAKLQAEKTAKLRQQRLAKEAEDAAAKAAAKELKAAGQKGSTKPHGDRSSV